MYDESEGSRLVLDPTGYPSTENRLHLEIPADEYTKQVNSTTEHISWSDLIVDKGKSGGLS